MTATSAQNDALIARGWAALPASYRIPEIAPTLEEARAYCRRLGRDALRELPCGHVVSAQSAAAAFSLDLRVLQDLRRSGRRGWRHARRPWRCSICGGANWMHAMRAARGIRYLWRWPRRFARARFPRSRLPICWRHFARIRRSRATLRWRTCWLLPLFGQSRRPPGALCMRRGERREFPARPMRPAPRCNSPTSGRMCAWTSPRVASICRRMTCGDFGVSDETIAAGHRHAGVSRAAALRS